MSQELMLKNIEKAEKEIAEKKDIIAMSKYRQKYHFMAQTGWINDPNGLIYFQGKYHFFYQFNPYSGFWSSMHWGHAVSDDMIHWEHLPVALAPSEWYDDHLQGGVFSGSTLVHDGKLFVMYTGTTNRGHGFEQAQCIAYSEDGIHFEKYTGNPVLTAPEGVPTDFFRDPKVWKHGDTFYCVCGAQKNGFSQALLYKSKDMFNWEFVNVLVESRGEWGFMFECPDFFKLGDKYVFVFSPMGQKYRTSVYMVGDFDYEKGRFIYTVTGEIDWGCDFYAPASFEDPKGRRIMVAWANCWDWMPFWKDWGPTYHDGWCGHFNIPRVASLNDDNTLSFKPIDEIKNFRKEVKSAENVVLADGESMELLKGFCYDLEIEIDLDNTDADQIALELRKSGGNVTEVVYDLANLEARFVRDNSDDWSLGTARGPLNLIGKEKLDLRILSDRISVETFANDYKTNISCNVYTTAENEGNLIKAVGGKVAIKSVKAYQLEV